VPTIAMMIGVFMSVLCSSECNAVVNPCPIAADLWVLAGQSNMQGYAVLREQAKPDRRIMMLNMDNKWMVAQEPVHRLYEAAAPIHRTLIVAGSSPAEYNKLKAQSQLLAVGGVGPGLFFAQHLVNNGVTGVGLIPSAHGGTSMDQWSPALKEKGDDSLYGAMINRIKSVGGKIKGVLWYQGESDTDEKMSLVYEQKMLDFIDSLRRDVNDPQLPILIVQIGRYVCNDLPASKGIAMEQVRESQRHIMSLRSNVYMVTGIDLPLDDVVHISFEGQKRLGNRLAEVALTKVYGKTGHADCIDVDSIKVFENSKSASYLKVRFKGVSGKLLSLGRPADFDLSTPPPADGYIIPYRTDFDQNDPATLIIYLQKAPIKQTKLLYGLGNNPYINIVDEKDMTIPAFGPIELPAAK
jgi:hypothetical protein